MKRIMNIAEAKGKLRVGMKIKRKDNIGIICDITETVVYYKAKTHLGTFCFKYDVNYNYPGTIEILEDVFIKGDRVKIIKKGRSFASRIYFGKIGVVEKVSETGIVLDISKSNLSGDFYFDELERLDNSGNNMLITLREAKDLLKVGMKIKVTIQDVTQYVRIVSIKNGYIESEDKYGNVFCNSFDHDWLVEILEYSNQYDDLKNRIIKLTGLTEESDEILKEIYGKFPIAIRNQYYPEACGKDHTAIVICCGESWAGLRLEEDLYFYYYSKEEKIQAIRDCFMWFLNHSLIKRQTLCHDSDTKVLTNKGWKKITDII